MKKSIFVIFSLFCFSQLVSSNINWTYPPTLISTSGITASDPHLAMDASGDVVAVWIENQVVKSKYKLSNAVWGPVSIVSGPTATSPRVVSDVNGNVTAIWLQGTTVYGASKTYLKVWGTPVALSASNASNPSLAVDTTGDVIAAWSRNGNIETSTKLLGGNWRTPMIVTNPGSAAVFPCVAMGGSGANTTAVLVWHSTASNIVYTSTKPVSSGFWSTAQAISNTANALEAGYAHVAVDANANATAVWYSYNVTGPVYSAVTVQAATRPAGGSWTSPVSISEPGILNPDTLTARVAYDATGNAVSLWTTSFDGENYSIQSAINPVYGSWTAPIVLVNSDLYSYQADQAVCSLGDAIAVYMFYNGVSLEIQSSELDITGFMNSMWSVPLNISSGTQNAYPFVAATLTGNVINSAAVWITANGITNSVVATTGSKTLVGPPSNLSVTQSTNNFGVFTEYYNTLSWQASTDPNAVGYLIYRNGTFLQQVPANVLEIVDDNQVQNGSVTYGVASVDNQQSHSPIITISY